MWSSTEMRDVGPWVSGVGTLIFAALSWQDAGAATTQDPIRIELSPDIVSEVRLTPFPARVETSGTTLLGDNERLAAAGDRTAATTIYEALEICKTAHRTRAALDAAVALLLAEHKLQRGDMSTPVLVVSATPSQRLAESELIRPFELCRR
jgi:hypothetical protein